MERNLNDFGGIFSNRPFLKKKIQVTWLQLMQLYENSSR